MRLARSPWNSGGRRPDSARQAPAPPHLWGLALTSERGLREVVANLLAELDLTFALSGYRSVSELDRSALAREDAGQKPRAG